MAIDLTPEMQRIGGYFAREMEQAVLRQRDLDGRQFQPVTIETARSRQRVSNRVQKVARAKGVKGRIPGTRKVLSTKSSSVGGLDFKRLLFTKKFVTDAYKFEPRRDEVRVFVNPSVYGGGVTYSDIVRYNNRGSSRVNPNIVNPPKIFPVSDAEVRKMTAYRKAVAELSSPAMVQKIVGRQFQKRITVAF